MKNQVLALAKAEGLNITIDSEPYTNDKGMMVVDAHDDICEYHFSVSEDGKLVDADEIPCFAMGDTVTL